MSSRGRCGQAIRTRSCSRWPKCSRASTRTETCSPGCSQRTVSWRAAEPRPIVLDLTAYQGQGLLGDLLCSVSNLLNQNGLLTQLTGQLQQLTATLNSLLSLLGGASGQTATLP